MQPHALPTSVSHVTVRCATRSTPPAPVHKTQHLFSYTQPHALLKSDKRVITQMHMQNERAMRFPKNQIRAKSGLESSAHCLCQNSNLSDLYIRHFSPYKQPHALLTSVSAVIIRAQKPARKQFAILEGHTRSESSLQSSLIFSEKTITPQSIHSASTFIYAAT